MSNKTNHILSPPSLQILILSSYPREVRMYLHTKTDSKCTFIQNSSKLETVQVSINMRIDNQIVACSLNRILLSNKKSRLLTRTAVQMNFKTNIK